MRSYTSPAVFIFVLCLMASVGVHLPVYSVLGWMGDLFERERIAKREAPEPVEIEFAPLDEPEKSTRDKKSVRRKTPEKEKTKKQTRKKEKVLPQEEAPSKPKRSPQRNLHAVEQKSDDPAVETPPDARYMAEENRKVEQETIARLRNAQRNDEQAQMTESSSASPDEGNATDSKAADLRQMQGALSRTVTPEEAEQKRPEHASEEPLPSAIARGDNRPKEKPVAEALEQETMEIHDANGSFVVQIPKRRGRSEAVRGGRGRGRGQAGPDLRVSWSDLEHAVGEKQLREERQSYVAERQSRVRGSNRAKIWKEFRSAVENYVADVRPGNQTALNTAASPFATYLTQVHRRIHREYAEKFLAGLPLGGTSPFSDRTLMTKLEIILNPDGTVHRVGVVQPSGLMPFDYGAFAAVMRGQPYPEAPDSIRSGNGKVYFHWGFYRNERQCGTFNAEPFILPNPPGTLPGGGPLQDHPLPGGVVPKTEKPSLGMSGKRNLTLPTT